MNVRSSILLGCLLTLLSLAALACGSDNSGPLITTRTPEPTVSKSVPSSAATGTAAPSGETSPAGTATGRTAAPTATPTPQPTAEQGTPAIAPQDQARFIAQFQGQVVSEQPCVYTPSTRLTDCGSFGKFAVNPPLSGQDISCAIVLLNNQARAIRCTSQEPLATLYYEIRA